MRRHLKATSQTNTKSIVWRDFMNLAAPPSGESRLPHPKSDLRMLSLLSELESSLRSSHRALLARDVSQLEVLTQQQSELQRAISNLQTDCNLGPSEEVRFAQLRILHLARIQRGLLTRLHRGLTTLAHLLAGTHADYSFPATHTGISLHPTSPVSREA
jgi:hypothetical protein